MPKKDPYGQFCPVATALDAIGDRWTLLVVRELFCGPLRFGEIRGGLQRVSSDVLTKRLKALVETGLATHDQAGYYELSPQGLALRPVLHEIGKWGALLWPPEAESPLVVREILTLIALGPLAFVPQPVSSTELRTTTVQRWITTSADGIEVTTHPIADPDTVIEADDATLSALVMGTRTWDEAITSNDLVVTGKPTFLTDFLDGLVPSLLELIRQRGLAPQAELTAP